MNKKPDILHTAAYIPCSVDELRILRMIAKNENLTLKKLLRVAIGFDDMPKRKTVPGMIY